MNTTIFVSVSVFKGYSLWLRRAAARGTARLPTIYCAITLTPHANAKKLRNKVEQAQCLFVNFKSENSSTFKIHG